MKSNNDSANFLSKRVGREEKRKIRALRDKRSVWFGLGMFGMVGWSVAVPSLLGALAGLWLDRVYPRSFSWALSLLVLGLLTGCVIAGYWIRKEHREMHENDYEPDDNNSK